MNRSANALIRSATTKIAVHCSVDVGVSRLRLFHQQRGSGHDLSRLTVAALRDVLSRPRLLQRMSSVGRESFDRDDLLRLHRVERRRARANRFAVGENRARAAQSHAAAELRAGERELVAKNPEQRRVGRRRNLARLAIDRECRHARNIERPRVTDVNNPPQAWYKVILNPWSSPVSSP